MPEQPSTFRMEGGAQSYSLLYKYSAAVRSIFGGNAEALTKLREGSPELFERDSITLKAGITRKQVLDALYKERNQFGLSGINNKAHFNRISTYAIEATGGTDIAPLPAQIDQMRANYMRENYSRVQSTQETYKNRTQDIKKDKKALRKTRWALAGKIGAGILGTVLTLGIVAGIGASIWGVVASALSASFGITSGFAVGGVALALVFGKAVFTGLGKMFSAIRNTKQAYKDHKRDYKNAKTGMRTAQYVQAANNQYETLNPYPGERLEDTASAPSPATAPGRTSIEDFLEGEVVITPEEEHGKEPSRGTEPEPGKDEPKPKPGKDEPKEPEKSEEEPEDGKGEYEEVHPILPGESEEDYEARMGDIIYPEEDKDDDEKSLENADDGDDDGDDSADDKDGVESDLSDEEKGRRKGKAPEVVTDTDDDKDDAAKEAARKKAEEEARKKKAEEKKKKAEEQRKKEEAAKKEREREKRAQFVKDWGRVVGKHGGKLTDSNLDEIKGEFVSAYTDEEARSAAESFADDRINTFKKSRAKEPEKEEPEKKTPSPKKPSKKTPTSEEEKRAQETERKIVRSWRATAHNQLITAENVEDYVDEFMDKYKDKSAEDREMAEAYANRILERYGKAPKSFEKEKEEVKPSSELTYAELYAEILRSHADKSFNSGNKELTAKDIENAETEFEHEVGERVQKSTPDKLYKINGKLKLPDEVENEMKGIDKASIQKMVAAEMSARSAVRGEEKPKRKKNSNKPKGKGEEKPEKKDPADASEYLKYIVDKYGKEPEKGDKKDLENIAPEDEITRQEKMEVTWQIISEEMGLRVDEIGGNLKEEKLNKAIDEFMTRFDAKTPEEEEMAKEFAEKKRGDYKLSKLKDEEVPEKDNEEKTPEEIAAEEQAKKDPEDDKEKGSHKEGAYLDNFREKYLEIFDRVAAESDGPINEDALVRIENEFKEEIYRQGLEEEKERYGAEIDNTPKSGIRKKVEKAIKKVSGALDRIPVISKLNGKVKAKVNTAREERRKAKIEKLAEASVKAGLTESFDYFFGKEKLGESVRIALDGRKGKLSEDAIKNYLKLRNATNEKKKPKEDEGPEME